MVLRDIYVCNLYIKIKVICNVVVFYVYVQIVFIDKVEMNNIFV